VQIKADMALLGLAYIYPWPLNLPPIGSGNEAGNIVVLHALRNTEDTASDHYFHSSDTAVTRQYYHYSDTPVTRDTTIISRPSSHIDGVR
jgi:hypothetical protein